MTISAVTPYAGAVPLRTGQSPSVFSANIGDMLTYLLTYIPELNTTTGQMNETATLMDNALALAEAASFVAAANSNFKGNYGALSGALNIPASVKYTDNKIYLLLDNLADVTSVVPGTDPATWFNYTDSISGYVNPLTTEGDLIVGGSGGTQARLPIGASTRVLTSNGTAASWEVPASGDANDDPQFVEIDLGDVAVSGSETIDFDLSLGNRFLCSMESSNTTGTLTFTVSNAPTAPWEIEVKIRRAGRKTIAWPSGWTYNQSITPTLDGSTLRYSLFNVRKEAFFTGVTATITLLTQQVRP